MLLVADHQQNYSYVMEDKDEARKFAIKHKGKTCKFIRPNDDREKGRVVGYNIRMV